MANFVKGFTYSAEADLLHNAAERSRHQGNGSVLPYLVTGDDWLFPCQDGF